MSITRAVFPSSCTTIGVPQGTNAPASKLKCDVHPECCISGWQPQGTNWSIKPGRCPENYYYTSRAKETDNIKKEITRYCCQSSYTYYTWGSGQNRCSSGKSDDYAIPIIFASTDLSKYAEPVESDLYAPFGFSSLPANISVSTTQPVVTQPTSRPSSNSTSPSSNSTVTGPTTIGQPVPGTSSGAPQPTGSAPNSAPKAGVSNIMGVGITAVLAIMMAGATAW